MKVCGATGKLVRGWWEQNGAASLEASLAVSSKVKCRPTTLPGIVTYVS